MEKSDRVGGKKRLASITMKPREKMNSQSVCETHKKAASHVPNENQRNFASQLKIETHLKRASHGECETHQAFASHQIYETQFYVAIQKIFNFFLDIL